MKTLFSDDIFGGRGFAPFGLAQAETAYSIFEDISGFIGVSEDDINKLFDKIPKEKWGDYQDRYKECREMGSTTTKGVACFYKLYRDMKKEADAADAAAMTSGATLTPRPSSSGFPYLPVGIGVLAATGLVVFMATR